MKNTRDSSISPSDNKENNEFKRHKYPTFEELYKEAEKIQMKKKKLKEEWAKKREIEEMKEVRDRPKTNYNTSQ